MKKSVCFGFCSLFAATSFAADTADLAKQLSNPVAAMISVPFSSITMKILGRMKTSSAINSIFSPLFPLV